MPEGVYLEVHEGLMLERYIRRICLWTYGAAAGSVRIAPAQSLGPVRLGPGALRAIVTFQSA